MSESLRVRNSNSIAKWVLSQQLWTSEIDGGNLKQTGFEKKYFEIQIDWRTRNFNLSYAEFHQSAYHFKFLNVGK